MESSQGLGATDLLDNVYRGDSTVVYTQTKNTDHDRCWLPDNKIDETAMNSWGVISPKKLGTGYTQMPGKPFIQIDKRFLQS